VSFVNEALEQSYDGASSVALKLQLKKTEEQASYSAMIDFGYYWVFF
jgi:hypothetical protein